MLCNRYSIVVLRNYFLVGFGRDGLEPESLVIPCVTIPSGVDAGLEVGRVRISFVNPFQIPELVQFFFAIILFITWF